MNRITEVEPTHEAAEYIARHLKIRDVAELEAYGVGMSAEALFPEWADLPGTSIFLGGGSPMAIAGVFDGRAWMFSTAEIETYRFEAHRIAKRRIREWVSEYGQLHNFVWIQNQPTIAWLMALGATFEDKVYRFAPNGGAFLRFVVK